MIGWMWFTSWHWEAAARLERGLLVILSGRYVAIAEEERMATWATCCSRDTETIKSDDDKDRAAL
jgi:hypothetical protein